MFARLLLVTLALSVIAPAMAQSSLRQTLVARLKPIPPATRGSGRFTAIGSSGKPTVIVHWRLAVKNLSGAIRRTSLQTPGPRKVTFVLCHPCNAVARGQLALIGSEWKRIVSKGATIVVTTAAHPRGELRGTLKRS